jgi:hypothetical protein
MDMEMKRKALLALTALTLAFGCTTAWADPVTMGAIHIESDSAGSLDLYIHSSLPTVYNGWASVGGMSITYLGKTFIGYCVDLSHSISPPMDGYATSASMTTWNGSGLFDGGMYGSAGDRGAYAAWLYNSYSTSMVTKEDRVALQLAIWNVLYDGDRHVDSGSAFWVEGVSAGVISTANGLMASLGKSDASWLQTQDKYGSDVQDFIGPRASVPEPGSALLLLIGLGVAAMTRRPSWAPRNTRG